MTLLLREISAVYTCDDLDQILRDAYIVVSDGRIAEVASGQAPKGPYDEIIDLEGCIVFPGFVNVHQHFFQTLTRAIPGAQRGHLLTWLSLLYPLWSRMTPDDLAAATEAACAELLLTGATTITDHCYLVPNASWEYIEAEVATAKAMGVRLNLIRGSLTALEADLEVELSEQLGPRAGGILDDTTTVLEHMRQTIERYHSPNFGSWTTVGLGPTTVTYETLDFMRDVADLAEQSGCGLHTHFHPRPDEREKCQRLFGKSPLLVLAETGWLRPGTWFAHGTRLDQSDMALLAEHGCAVAHCPRMILRLGARITPVHELRAHGIRIGLGVDGAASNDCGSMVSELRIAPLLHRLAGGEGTVPHTSWLDPYDVLIMATRDGANIIGRTDLGQISVGKLADLTAFDLQSVGYAGARTDLLSAFILAGSDSRAALTMVGGRPLVRNGQLVNQNERKIREKVDKATARLIAEVSRATGRNYCAFPARF
jgi:cytosine/adenosine deaminase-related metal-dependent hydrolase